MLLLLFSIGRKASLREAVWYILVDNDTQKAVYFTSTYLQNKKIDITNQYRNMVLYSLRNKPRSNPSQIPLTSTEQSWRWRRHSLSETIPLVNWLLQEFYYFKPPSHTINISQQERSGNFKTFTLSDIPSPS